MGLDLVEVSADSDPPVCRILDYGKFKYEQSKKDKANKAKSKAVEMKEVRLGRSMKIDPHDVMIRMNQARRFLMDGHKVQIVQNFRGREMIHRHRGNDRMNDIIEQLSDISKVEMVPRMAGRRMTMILAPEKAKIEQIRRREAAEREKKQAGSDSPEPAEASAPPEPASSQPPVPEVVVPEVPAAPVPPQDTAETNDPPAQPEPAPQEIEAPKA